MSILNYSKELLTKMCREGIVPHQSVRDWEIMAAKREGKKIQEIADDHQISRVQVYNVIRKFRS